jgi:hypothetical protein
MTHRIRQVAHSPRFVVKNQPQHHQANHGKGDEKEKGGLPAVVEVLTQIPKVLDAHTLPLRIDQGLFTRQVLSMMLLLLFLQILFFIWPRVFFKERKKKRKKKEKKS